MAEAIEWTRRMPGVEDGEEVELRPVGELEDFGDALTPDERRDYETNVLQKAAKLREKTAKH